MKKRILSFESVKLSKFILSTILPVCVVCTGCYYTSQYSQNLNQVRSRLSMTETSFRNEAESLNQKYVLLNSRITAFIQGLSDNELEVYGEINSKINSQNLNDPASAELNKRRLDKVLSQENKKIWEQIIQDVAVLEIEKATLIAKIKTHDQQVSAYNQRLLAYSQTVAIQQQRNREEQRNREAMQAFGNALKTYGAQQQGLPIIQGPDPYGGLRGFF